MYSINIIVGLFCLMLMVGSLLDGNIRGAVALLILGIINLALFFLSKHRMK